MSKKIPARWLVYSNSGERITGTPFVAFKTPLKKEFNHGLPREKIFQPSMLLDLLPDLKLVIDLTDTYRYYDCQEFTKAGIAHEKIRCPGHVIPPEHLVNRFFNVVDAFIEENKLCQSKLIGVHCTHGLNRTGYFICRYLIERMGITPSDAINGFNAARGHRMERCNYLDYLRNCQPFKSLPLKAIST